MKIAKYIACALMLVAAVACQKHQIIYDTTKIADLGKTAEFQLHFFVPQTTAASQNVDSVFVNGVRYASIKGTTAVTFSAMNGIPSTAGRFYVVAPGKVNIVLWRGGEEIYNQTTTLKEGKVNIFIYDYEKEPIVLDNEYPYFNATRVLDLEHFGTDTVSSVRFINLLFEEKGKPYEGKLQYQYRQYNTKDTIDWTIDEKTGLPVPVTEYRWVNFGKPVGFGETTGRLLVPVDQINGISASGKLDQAAQALYYRILVADESKPQSEWEPMMHYAASGDKVMSVYSDYWTATVGRSTNHILCGIRTSNANTADETYSRVVSWTSN